MFAGAALLTGCSNAEFDLDNALDTGFKNLFSARKTPQQHMLLAVTSVDPDVRRKSVAKISDSDKYDQEWAIKGYVAIACLDNDEQTRCVAIRALARTGDPRATETLLKVLNYKDHPPAEVWPPTPLVRWDTAEGLSSLSAGGHIAEEHRESVRKVLLGQLRTDLDRHARIAAARGLGYYPHEETLHGLIAGLDDSDYAVAHECESSLVRLTGRTHHANPLAWSDWLEENANTPFAHAGDIPESRRPPYNTKWEKFKYDTKDTIQFLWPGAREE